MELEEFITIRDWACQFPNVSEGKMMASPAIHYKGKVIAFLSRERTMVFKLEKNFSNPYPSIELNEFSPFKTKKPLPGWYETSFQYRSKWRELTRLAYTVAQGFPDP